MEIKTESYKESFKGARNGKRITVHAEVVEREEGYFAKIEYVVKWGWFLGRETGSELRGPFSTFAPARATAEEAVAEFRRDWSNDNGGSSR